MNFEFATTGRIIFGVGKVKEVGSIASSFGDDVLLVCGKHVRDHTEEIIGLSGLSVTKFVVDKEPDIACIGLGLVAARDAHCDIVIAMGGGSVLDAGKAIAALATNPGPMLNYLEVIGFGKRLINRPLPVIAIPTTAGTGSEVTRNAVLSIPDLSSKVSLRDAKMLPQVALVDPALTLSMPPAVTACSGMDALTQLIEPFVSSKATPIVDLFCQEGIDKAARNIRTVFESGDCLDARVKMAWASLLGGLSLANAGLGAVHGFAGALGGLFGAPHGALCAALLPAVFKINAENFQVNRPSHPILNRFLMASRLLASREDATLHDGISWLEETTGLLKIPRLRDYGLSVSDFPKIIAKAATSSSMKANPVELTGIELNRILDMSL